MRLVHRDRIFRHRGEGKKFPKSILNFEIAHCIVRRSLVVRRHIYCRETWTITMVHASFINRLSHAVDQIEERQKLNRPWKVVTVRRRLHEDGNAACDRHFALHPEDQGANVVVYYFSVRVTLDGLIGTRPNFRKRAGSS